MPIGRDEEGRIVREEIEQIRKEAQESEHTQAQRIEESNGKIIDFKNDAQKNASQQEKLLNLRETLVQQLAEHAPQANVINWVEDLTIHWGGAEGWMNTTNVLMGLETAKEFH